MKISRGEVLTINSDRTYDEIIENYGTITTDPTKDFTAIFKKSIVNYGKIIIKPNTSVRKQHILFKDVNQNMTGTVRKNKEDANWKYPTPELKVNEVGLWNMEGGIMEIEGSAKKVWTNSLGGIPKGAKSAPMVNTNNWQIGDKIVISTFEMPEIKMTEGPNSSVSGTRWWDSGAKKFNDKHADKNEEVTITGFTGNLVLWAEPLKYDHNPVTAEPDILAPMGRVYNPYISNLTRNVKITGEKDKNSHIFSMSRSTKTPHSFRNVEVQFMGVRNKGRGKDGSDGIIDGRYAMYFEMCQENTQGTFVTGCSFHDINSRCWVSHISDGIQYRNNAVHNVLGEVGWWEFQDISHNIMYCNNMITNCLWDHQQQGGTCFLLGMGTNNMCVNNVKGYANQGDPDGSGADQWTTDNESVWLFDNNITFASNNADWTWQNSGRPHAITRSITINCNFAITHGAYQNAYIYFDCVFINSFIKARASGGINGGSSWHRCVLNGLNKIINPENNRRNLADVWTSAVGNHPNQFKECEFLNAECAVEFDLFKFNGDGPDGAKARGLEMINNKYTNVATKARFRRATSGGDVANCWIKIQNGNDAHQLDYGNNQRSISKFAPDKFGTGDGLKAEYYRGAQFQQKVLEIVESYVRHDDWRIEAPKMKEGVLYAERPTYIGNINEVPFSARYTGEIEAPWTRDYKFRLWGASGYRLWIKGQLLIDSSSNKHDNSEYADSKGTIRLNARERNKIIIELYEPGDTKKGIGFMWDYDGNGFKEVEMCQLYSLVPYNPFPPSVPPVYPIEQPEVPIEIPEPGKDYCKIFNAQDYLVLNPDVKANWKGTAESHYEQYGKKENRAINRLCGSNTGTPTESVKDPCTALVPLEYLALYDDIRKAVEAGRTTAEKHWNENGKAEGRRPQLACRPTIPTIPTTPVSDCVTLIDSEYLEMYPDVKVAVNKGQMTAKQHWDNHGKKEGRKPNKSCIK